MPCQNMLVARRLQNISCVSLQRKACACSTTLHCSQEDVGRAFLSADCTYRPRLRSGFVSDRCIGRHCSWNTITALQLRGTADRATITALRLRRTADSAAYRQHRQAGSNTARGTRRSLENRTISRNRKIQASIAGVYSSHEKHVPARRRFIAHRRTPADWNTITARSTGKQG